MNTLVQPLRVDNTMTAGHIRHRLAMGVQWIDAVTGLPVQSRLGCALDALGDRPLIQRFERHAHGRHALRWAGPLARLLVRAAEDKIATPPLTPADDPTNFNLRVFGQAGTAGPYATDADPRHHVPRRLALTPIQTDGEPPAAIDNIRTGWLWPGANYPLGANATAIRGRIRQGPSLPAAQAVPWARVIITRPADINAVPNFAGEPAVAWAHGDDRGEFLAVLGNAAVPGGATLPASLPLRLWVFLPPATSLDATDPLASLPLEQAQSDAINDVLRGIAVPAGYLMQPALSFPLVSGESIRPGRIVVVNDAALRFP